MGTVCCITCTKPYDFKDGWLKKHKAEEFVCRKCKIKAAWTPERKQATSAASREKLKDPAIKAIMSEKATANNAKNALKISESLKTYFKEHPESTQRLKKQAEKLWATKRQVISEKIKAKWKDDSYRQAILTKRFARGMRRDLQALTKKERDIRRGLQIAGKKFEIDFFLNVHKFRFLVEGKTLIDTEPTEERRLFVEHYFPQYIYTTG